MPRCVPDSSLRDGTLAPGSRASIACRIADTSASTLSDVALGSGIVTEVVCAPWRMVMLATLNSSPIRNASIASPGFNRAPSSCVVIIARPLDSAAVIDSIAGCHPQLCGTQPICLACLHETQNLDRSRAHGATSGVVLPHRRADAGAARGNRVRGRGTQRGCPHLRERAKGTAQPRLHPGPPHCDCEPTPLQRARGARFPGESAEGVARALPVALNEATCVVARDPPIGSRFTVNGALTTDSQPDTAARRRRESG